MQRSYQANNLIIVLRLIFCLQSYLSVMCGSCKRSFSIQSSVIMFHSRKKKIVTNILMHSSWLPRYGREFFRIMRCIFALQSRSQKKTKLQFLELAIFVFMFDCSRSSWVPMAKSWSLFNVCCVIIGLKHEIEKSRILGH